MIITKDGKKIRIADDLIVKHGELIPPGPEIHYSVALTPITKDEWKDYTLSRPSINAPHLEPLANMLLEEANAFLACRLKKLLSTLPPDQE